MLFMVAVTMAMVMRMIVGVAVVVMGVCSMVVV